MVMTMQGLLVSPNSPDQTLPKSVFSPKRAITPPCGRWIVRGDGERKRVGRGQWGETTLRVDKAADSEFLF